MKRRGAVALAAFLWVLASCGQPTGTVAAELGGVVGMGGLPSLGPQPLSRDVSLHAVPAYPKGSAFEDPDYFPTGVWLESIQEAKDLATDQAAGINTYVGLTASSDLTLARSAGARVILQQSEWLGRPVHPAAWLLDDEPDMKLEADPGAAHLRRIAAALPLDGTPRYTNYGKGVAFWNTRDEASRYINTFQDFVSVDAYWFTDLNICGASEGGRWWGSQVLTEAECHNAANYGRTVARVRHVDARDDVLQPVWGYVEVGHPFTEEEWPAIAADQITAAVWHSIIGGAQGIVYFNHSFGGPCPTQHALREPCYADQRAAVTAVNSQIDGLARVLNSPTAVGFERSRHVRTMVKKAGGSWYIFAASDGSIGRRTFALAQGTAVEVIGESRTLDLEGRTFTDSFDTPTTVHIYRVVTE